MPGPYSPPPGTVMVMPAQPPSYVGPVVMPPPTVVVVPASPLPSYPWKVGIDALFLERSSPSISLGATYYNQGSKLPQALPTGELFSDDMPFLLTAGVRLEVSRKFNDNMTLAATYWGLQQWSVTDTIYGDPAGETVLATSPYLRLPLFDNMLSYTYSSQIQNVELNTLFRLNPSDPYWRVDWLCGARYVYLADNLTLLGVDDYSSAMESRTEATANNLVGMQTGLLFVHGWSRVQWEAGLKVGLMANIYHQHEMDALALGSIVPTGFSAINNSNTSCGLSGLIEVSFAACYSITDNFGIRLGYQFYDFIGLALGPRQLGGFGHGGYEALDGVSIGLQATW